MQASKILRAWRDQCGRASLSHQSTQVIEEDGHEELTRPSVSQVESAGSTEDRPSHEWTDKKDESGLEALKC